MRRLPILLLLLCQGCATNAYLKTPHKDSARPLKPTMVYVTNSNSSPERAILERSGIFEITTDPQCPNRVTVDEFHPRIGCGMPFMGPIVTLGILPGSAPMASHFQFKMSTPSETNRISYRLPVYLRMSIWERLFRLWHSNEKVLATALNQAANPKSQP